MLPRLSNLTCEERLAKIEIPSIKYSRMHGDMIMVYKVLNMTNQWNIYLPLIIIQYQEDNFNLKKTSIKTTNNNTPPFFH